MHGRQQFYHICSCYLIIGIAQNITKRTSLLSYKIEVSNIFVTYKNLRNLTFNNILKSNNTFRDDNFITQGTHTVYTVILQFEVTKFTNLVKRCKRNSN